MAGTIVRRVAWSRVPLEQQFKIHDIDGDYVICHTWDGTTEGLTDIPVAKPYLLRRTPFDGGSRNSISYTYTSDSQRTASKSGESDITEIITPSYQVGDIIYAKRNIRGGTSVAAAPSWIDCNYDGRCWAESD